MIEPADILNNMPMQPVVVDPAGIPRFKENRIVTALLNHSQQHGFGMNEIARGDYTAEERMQLAQLIGYSVAGYGTLSYVNDLSYGRAVDAIPKECPAQPTAQVSAEPVAWANWKVGSKSYVPYRTREEAAACVKNSSISATQEGPYAVVALYAAPVASAAPVVPEGYALVPIEPTIEMLEAAWAEEVSLSDAHTEHGVTLHVWDAMLAAAPKEPTT